MANQDGTVELWDLAGSEPISRTLPGKHDDWAFSVAYDPTGSRLASAGKDGVIILWSELASSNPVSQPLTDHDQWVNVVAFSPDGTQLAAGSDDSTLRLWDLSQDPPSSIELDNHSDLAIEVWDLAFTSDGTRLAAGWGDNLVRVYDLAQPGAAAWQLAGHGGEVSRVAFDPAAPQRLVSLSIGDYEPIAWDLSRRSEFASVQPISMPVSATLRAISPNGRWLAVAGDTRTALLGDAVGNSPVISHTAGMTITAAALSGDGARIALAGCQETLPPEPSATPDSTKTPDPNQAVTPAGPRLTGCRLDVLSPDGDKVTSPTWTTPSTQPIVALAFRPQHADQWAMALESGEVQTYGGFEASAVSLAPRVTGVVDLAFNSDGSQLAALDRDGTVVIWNWANGELVSEYSPDASQEGIQFGAIAFVQGDAWLALTTSAPQLELRERSTWTVVDRFTLDFGRAADLALDAAGQTLVAALPGSLMDWPMDQGRWLELACTAPAEI